MKRTAIFLVAISIVVVLSVLVSRSKKVVIYDFSWSISGKTAPYSFSVSNRTKEELRVVVVLDAENIREGRDGTKLRPVGTSKIEISLTAHETRKVEGTIDLLELGSGATTVSFGASIEEPTKSATVPRL